MTDKELLELAARAYGFGAENGSDKHFCWTESEYPRGAGLHGALWNFRGYMDTAELFNSLTSDADAFRLAVKLKMEVATWNSDTTVQTDEVDIVEEKHNGDPYAATRRAITRAAAAIAQERGDE